MPLTTLLLVLLSHLGLGLNAEEDDWLKWRMRQVKMGVLGVDYQYDTNFGDLLDARSHEMTTVYAAVPGLSFELCKTGNYSEEDIEQNRNLGLVKADAKPGDLPDEVEANLRAATRALLDAGADFITGDCGFMFYWQIPVRRHVMEWASEKTGRKQAQVMMSSLNVLPQLLLSTPFEKKICVLTAEEKWLRDMGKHLERVKKMQLGENKSFINFQELLNEKRVAIHGMDILSTNFSQALNKSPLQWSQDWEDRRTIMSEVAWGAKELVKNDPSIHCFVIECTEAYGFAAQIKWLTGLPVYTGNSAASFMSLAYSHDLPGVVLTDETGSDPNGARDRPNPVYGKISQGVVRIILKEAADKEHSDKKFALSVQNVSTPCLSKVVLLEHEDKIEDKDCAQRWLFENNKIKLFANQKLVLTLDNKTDQCGDTTHGTIRLKEDAGDQGQLWLYSEKKFKSAANPSFVLGCSTTEPQNGAAIVPLEDTGLQTPKWRLAF